MEKCLEEGRVKITHFAHPHPVVLSEVEKAEAKVKQCSACLESILFGSIFSCEECNHFHLHKFCAEAPSQINHSPYHCKQHPSLTLHTNVPSHYPYTCDLCKETRKNMFVYLCSSCLFCLGIKCALLLHNIDENFRELRYLGHQHPLKFIQHLIKNPNPDDDNDESVKSSSISRADCYWCHKSVVDSGYVCSQSEESKCRSFYLHKKCARSPVKVYHPCDRKHPLYIEHGELVCQICENKHWSFFYRCLPCNLDIDIECVQSRPRPVTTEYMNNHEHSFNQVLRPDPFICDACGIEGKYNSYMCSICCIMIHKKCISLPHIIRTTRHHHYVIHNYFFQKEDFEENQECGICLGEVDMQYGSYSCSKLDCNYVSHVNCAMEMYDTVDHLHDQDDDEESSEYLARNSSITCVVERNEHGEATKVKHFCHEHDLTLGNEEIKEGDHDGVPCDGCMLSISFSTQFYYCSQCEFHLHKACAELPRKKHHWFDRSLTSLESKEFFKCNQCNRLCSGFAYENDYDYFCLRCVSISHTPKRARHEHTLFFDFKFEGECNACGVGCRNGAFKCKHCTWFALDFACITLPQATWHKCDKHPFKLAFHDGNDDPEQQCCDVCEKEKNPNYWFYQCTICDNSAHLKCVLGKFPFIKTKIEVPFPYPYHPHYHSLFFVAKNIYDMICSRCHKPLQDVALALECRDCKPNYVIHFDCWSESFGNIRDS